MGAEFAEYTTCAAISEAGGCERADAKAACCATCSLEVRMNRGDGGTCDKCGGTEFRRRADDNAETVASRLDAYHAQTAPLIAYYKAQGALIGIDAMGEIDDIARKMTAIVKTATA